MQKKHKKTLILFILLINILILSNSVHYLSIKNSIAYKEFFNFTQNYEIFPEIYEIIYSWTHEIRYDSNLIKNEKVLKYSKIPYYKSLEVKLDKVDILEFNNLELIWQRVPNSRYYRILIYKNSEEYKIIDVSNTINYLNINHYLRDVGIYEVKIKALGDGKLYLDGDYSDISQENIYSKKLNTVNFNKWENNKISWNYVNNAEKYLLELFLNEQKILEKFISENEFDISDYKDKTGIYRVRIKTIGDEKFYLNSDFSEFSENNIKYEHLDQVRLNNWENDIISWQKIDNADKYIVEIIFNLERISTDSTYDLKYDISDIKKETGKYRVRVKAVSESEVYLDGRFSLLSEENIKSEKLQRVILNSWDKDNISWNKIDNAEKYLIELFFNNEKIYEKKQLNLNYNISNHKTKTGIYNLRVKALGDDNLYLEGEFSEFSENNIKSETLNQVKLNLWQEDIINWTPINNSEGYKIEVFFNDELLYKDYTEKNNYNISSLKTKAGTYKVRVKALGDNKIYYDSIFSNFSTLNIKSEQLDKVKLNVWKGDIITWEKIKEAEIYLVEVFYYEQKIKTDITPENKYDISSVKEKPGEYRVRVKAIGDSLIYLESEYSQMSEENIKTKILEIKEDKKWNFYELIWENVEGAKAYKINLFKDNNLIYELTLDNNRYNFYNIINGYGPGYYNARIKPLGDGRIYLDGDFTNKNDYLIKSKILEIPENIGWSGYIFEWDYVQSSIGYKLFFYKNDELLNEYYINHRNYINFKTILNDPGKYEISFQVLGDNKIFLNSQKYHHHFINVVSKTLSPPNKFFVEGNTLYWSEVKYSLNYMIRIYYDKQNFSEYLLCSESKLFDITEYYQLDNLYNISIQVIGDDYVYYSSEEKFLFEKFIYETNSYNINPYIRVF